MSDSPTLLQTMAAAVDLHKQHQRLKASHDGGPPDSIPSLRKTATLPMSNNNGAPAPPLVLLKRVTPPKEEPMSKFSTLLKSAVTNLESGRLDQAERALAECEQMQKHSFHFYGDNTVDDDESDFESPSDPSNDEPDDDDELDKRSIRKASYHHPYLGGAAPLPKQPSGTARGEDQQADTYSLGTTPATRAASPHKFDRLVEHVMERDSCSKNAAMATARREYPDAYESYQSFVAGSPTNEQATRRAGRGVGKRMPDSYEDLVAAEMRKGVPWRIAEQRVINVHGSTALNNRMIKRDGPSVAAEFSKRATAIMWNDGVDRTEALRRLRKEQPWLYDALNAS